MKTILLLFVSIGLFAQTKIDTRIQTKLDVTQLSVLLVLPGVGVIPATLDSTLVLTSNGGVYTLSAAPKPTIINFQEDRFKTTVAQSAFVSSKPLLGNKSGIMVFHNGLLQREIEDYGAQENVGIWTITFNTPVPIGSLVTIRYPSV